MTIFLIRSLTESAGFVSLERLDGTLPRTGVESYVPWAITSDGRVVYAKTGEHTGWRGGGGKDGPSLRPYNTSVSQDRRRLTESELGLFALDYPQFTRDAVNHVTLAIRKYHDLLYITKRTLLTETIFNTIGSYFYTGGRTGFGRISEVNHTTMTPEAVRKGIMHALVNGTLDQKLSIHDAFGRKILPVLGGEQLVSYNHWGPILRQDWFDDVERRGRVNVRGAVATQTGGIVTGNQGGLVGTTGQARTRGVDGFARDVYRTPEPGANDYYDDLDARNLLFGAGISGTTGTLLQSALAFGGPMAGDMLKQYVFAIIGYLVGGGMHSYHESLAVARKAGLAYTPGVYLPSLPMAFTASMQCRVWSAKYYDIVHLGATHWRHSTPTLPSHLNRKLGNRPRVI